MMIDSIPDTATIATKVADIVSSETLTVKEKIGFFTEKLPQLADWAIKIGMKLILAIVILIVGFWIAKQITKLCMHAMERHGVDKSLRMFVRSICSAILKIIVIIIAVQMLGIQTMSFAAIIASLGVGIGMAMSGTLQNFAGGVVLMFFKPFKAGDFIESQGMLGTVLEVKIFMTEIKTIDNKILYIPNSSLISAPITNYTKENLRRVDIDFGVGYGTKLDEAKKIIADIAANEKRILKDPAPCFVVSSLADSAVIITARVWTTTADYWDVKFDLNEHVYNAFNEKNIEIPFPQVQVHMSKD